MEKTSTLYDYHTSPTLLVGSGRSLQWIVPELALDLAKFYHHNSQFRHGAFDPELQKVILKNPQVACRYAIDILKTRWPEAEPVLIENSEAAIDYAENIIKGRWKQAEPYILATRDMGKCILYAQRVINGRWPEAESHIFQDYKSSQTLRSGGSFGKDKRVMVSEINE